MSIHSKSKTDSAIINTVVNIIRNVRYWKQWISFIFSQKTFFIRKSLSGTWKGEFSPRRTKNQKFKCKGILLKYIYQYFMKKNFQRKCISCFCSASGLINSRKLQNNLINQIILLLVFLHNNLWLYAYCFDKLVTNLQQLVKNDW